MADGYQDAGEHDFADLDEWLCEYVDGTIDPVVCKALEEYMQHNDELASHVERLREARFLLCQYGCSYRAPSGLQPRLRRRLASEIIQESQPFLGASAVHLMTLATITSVVAILLIFAASTDSTTTLSFPETLEQSVTEAHPLKTPRLLTPLRRTTPVRTLATNKYYARFTSYPAYSQAYLSNSLFPLDAYMVPLTVDVSRQSAQPYYTAP